MLSTYAQNIRFCSTNMGDSLATTKNYQEKKHWLKSFDAAKHELEKTGEDKLGSTVSYH